jgi:D-3-phosphoglycerate dehydrogenase
VKVLITARSAAKCKVCTDLLTAKGYEVIDGSGAAPKNEKEMINLIKDVDAVIAGVDEITGRVIEAGMPNLKIIARNGVGYNHVDILAAKIHNVTVTLSVGTNNVSVCELVFGLIFNLARNINTQNTAIDKGQWSRVMGIELDGKTIGIAGTGHIGTAVAIRAHAFGMKILACDIAINKELVNKYGVIYTDMDTIFREADIITLHLPATAETNNIINESTLSLMKPSTILINAARGDLVDEKALAAALQAKKIAGYGADTLKQEPPREDEPLLKLSNVILTPHCGGYTKDAVIKSSVTAAEEVIRVLSGKPAKFPVQ